MSRYAPLAVVPVFLLALAWRVWTPIDGARRVYDGGLVGLVAVALLGLVVAGLLRWRGLPALLAAGVAMVVALATRPVLLHAFPSDAAWLGLVVPRVGGTYPGAATWIAAAVAVAARPPVRTLPLVGVAALLLLTGNSALAVLPLVVLAAQGLDAVGPRAARPLAGVAFAALVVLGVAVTVTTRAGKATPMHDALVAGFFGWVMSAWLLWRLAVDDGRWRRLLLVVVALAAVCEVWFAAVPNLEARFAKPPPSAVRR